MRGVATISATSGRSRRPRSRHAVATSALYAALCATSARQHVAAVVLGRTSHDHHASAGPSSAIASLSELIRSRAEWVAANLNDPEWAGGLAEEITHQSLNVIF
jgi:hypothetical protein